MFEDLIKDSDEILKESGKRKHRYQIKSLENIRDNCTSVIGERAKLPIWEKEIKELCTEIIDLYKYLEDRYGEEKDERDLPIM